jgi:subfamily B ATP-binding cassette protein MsbA
MDSLKSIIKKYFGSFVFFYHYLRNKIFIAMGFSIAVSILDGFGLSMFLPLLQVVDNNGSVNAEEMGNLRFLIDGIEALGVNLTIGFVLLFMLLFFAFKGVAYYFSSLYIVILQQSFIKSMRLRLLNSLNRMNFKSFVTSDAGQIQNTMSGEVDNVARGFSSYFGTIEQGVMVVVYMTFAFFVNVQFAVLVTIGGIATNFLYKIIYNRTKKASLKLTDSNNNYQGLIIQHVANFKYLKATGKVRDYSARLENEIIDIESSRKKIGVLGSISSATKEPLLVAVVACVILVQTKVFGGAMGSILISLLFFYRALNSLVFTQLHWNAFLSVSGSMENMKNFQNKLESNREKNGDIPFGKFEDSIVINQVDFSYGDFKILKNINLDIQKNQSIAFVGESGSGKTTLVNLIAALLPQDNGSLYIDGLSFGDLEKSTYQKRIGYITQDPVIFNDSIYNNVTFWSELTPENIHRFEKAIQQASLAKFLNTLPDGKDTELGNNGINLSGGQKQRISIARELYKDIDILIMDEATSALDSETEVAIQQSIEALKGKYTILIVAHRLSTIRNVDRIVYMNNGKIESEGSFSELVYKQPRFKKMVELQEI